ncbi:MAG TPA: hypothetical protein VGE81_06505 [Candidatus Limnocylindrales bacterium]
MALAQTRLRNAGDRSNLGTAALEPGPALVYVLGVEGLRGARLAAARVAGLGAPRVTVAAASPGHAPHRLRGGKFRGPRRPRSHHTVSYDASLSATSALGGKTYDLAGV